MKMKGLLKDLLDELEFFVNSRKSNKDVEHIDELIKIYRNKAINYTHCCKSDSEQLSKRPNTSSSLECFTKLEKQQKGDV